MPISIKPASPEHLDAIRSLLRDYRESLGVDLCFQSFAEELAGLPGKYAPPTGALWIALNDDEAVGCVALREIAPGVGEMKRLYVKPSHRGRGLGRQLARAVIEVAHARGCSRLRLDTLETLREAAALYASLSFVRIPAYYENPLPSVEYWEIRLGQ
jgi:putative acetyltransferase